MESDIVESSSVKIDISIYFFISIFDGVLGSSREYFTTYTIVASIVVD